MQYVALQSICHAHDLKMTSLCHMFNLYKQLSVDICTSDSDLGVYMYYVVFRN